jgi:hypothetical protein
MTKAFIERVKRERFVVTKNYRYYAGYERNDFVIARESLTNKYDRRIVYREKY